MSEAGHRCLCINARSIVNKKNELNIMVEDPDPRIIGITDLGLTGYIMFRRGRIGRRGGGIILYVKELVRVMK